MAKAQMAGKLLQYLTKGLRKADGALDMGQVGMRVVPDAVFGGLAAIQTPGDLGDKLIAGTTSALGGSLGGLALGGLTPNPIASLALDTAGSLGGDMLGYQVGDQLMRAKDKLSGGKGQTPYERMGAREQAIYEEQLRRQIMAQYGLLPGTREQYAGMG
mgnify:CR=1 FL=1